MGQLPLSTMLIRCHWPPGRLILDRVAPIYITNSVLFIRVFRFAKVFRIFSTWDKTVSEKVSELSWQTMFLLPFFHKYTPKVLTLHFILTCISSTVFGIRIQQPKTKLEIKTFYTITYINLLLEKAQIPSLASKFQILPGKLWFFRHFLPKCWPKYGYFNLFVRNIF